MLKHKRASQRNQQVDPRCSKLLRKVISQLDLSLSLANIVNFCKAEVYILCQYIESSADCPTITPDQHRSKPKERDERRLVALKFIIRCK
jgi:hypothetical protein